MESDLCKRFGTFEGNYVAGEYRKSWMGVKTRAKGFLANKAWLLQLSMDYWKGNIQNKINQQLSPTLDIKLMNPVGGTYDKTLSAADPVSTEIDNSMMSVPSPSSGGSYGSY